jgi:HTH-type transcriptional repressor of NAD biosynthesis genes
MSARFRRGLVVGKFAPLHKGPELVIGRALADCDEVVVISYSKPELPGCSPENRALWLEARFPTARRLVLSGELLRAWGPREMPHNDAPAEQHRRFVAEVCHEQLRCFVDAVFTSEDYGEGFAAALTGYFQEWDPSAPAVVHVPVDRDRRQLPVSGTLIRGDVHAHRQWLSPEVYASFVGRVCLLGGESSGKSTLAEQLARACNTTWVPEYGRALWEQRAGVLALPDMRHIAERQVALEEEALRAANRWLFCDTSPLTTLFYSRDLFGQVEPALEALARRPYDVTLLCAPDFPFVQDGTRREPGFRERQHAFYLEALAASGTPFSVLRGDVPSRVAQALALLEDVSR